MPFYTIPSFYRITSKRIVNNWGKFYFLSIRLGDLKGLLLFTLLLVIVIPSCTLYSMTLYSLKGILGLIFLNPPKIIVVFSKYTFLI